MSIYLQNQKQFQKVFKELEIHFSVTQKEASRALYNYRCKYRICLNSGDLDNKSLLTSKTEWDKNHQTLKTLEQIHKIFKNHKTQFDIYNVETIDRELMSYTILSTQKELFSIAKLFASYRDKLFNY